MTWDTAVALLRALVSLGVVLGLIWWAGRRLTSGKGPVGGSTAGPRTSVTGRRGAFARASGWVRDTLRGARRGAQQQPAIVVVGRQALTPKAGLALVEVGGRRLLLGVGDQGVTVLDTQDVPPVAAVDAASELVTDEVSVTSSGAAFATELDHAVGSDQLSAGVLPDAVASVPDAVAAGDAQVLTLASRGDALDGSILSPATWRRAASALQQGRR